MGVTNPAQHIAMLATDKISTLLVSKQPFTAQEITRLQQLSTDLEFEPVIIPGSTPGHEVLARIVAATSPSNLTEAISQETLNYAPSTDEQPYFFN